MRCWRHSSPARCAPDSVPDHLKLPLPLQLALLAPLKLGEVRPWEQKLQVPLWHALALAVSDSVL